MYGLGGPTWSSGIENVVAKNIRKIPNVVCPPTRNHTEWKTIVDEISKLEKGTKVVVVGHSMGAASATYITDYVYVDLLVLYDLAGKKPSKLGKNTGSCIDIHDTFPDIVPEWRVEPVSPQHAHKIERWKSNFGHTNQDDSVELMEKIVTRIKKLAEF
jgi:hypothetical protein